MDFDHGLNLVNDFSDEPSSTQEQQFQPPTWDTANGDWLRHMERHIDQLIADQNNQNLETEAYVRRTFRDSLYYEQLLPAPQQTDQTLPETVDPRMTMILQNGFDETGSSLPERYTPNAEFSGAFAPAAVIEERVDSPVDTTDPGMVTQNGFDDIYAGFLPEPRIPDAGFSETYAPVAVMKEGVDSQVEPRNVRSEQRISADNTIPWQEHESHVTFARTEHSRSAASNGGLPALPASIFAHGFTPEDFDATTKYESDKPSKGKFKPFPDDLPETYIFKADPSQIAYDNILRVATKYTNAQIQAKINKGRPEMAVRSSQVIDSRIKTALAWRAEKENVEGGK